MVCATKTESGHKCRQSIERKPVFVCPVHAVSSPPSFQCPFMSLLLRSLQKAFPLCRFRRFEICRFSRSFPFSFLYVSIATLDQKARRPRTTNRTQTLHELYMGEQTWEVPIVSFCLFFLLFIWILDEEEWDASCVLGGIILCVKVCACVFHSILWQSWRVIEDLPISNFECY